MATSDYSIRSLRKTIFLLDLAIAYGTGLWVNSRGSWRSFRWSSGKIHMCARIAFACRRNRAHTPRFLPKGRSSLILGNRQSMASCLSVEKKGQSMDSCLNGEKEGQSMVLSRDRAFRLISTEAACESAVFLHLFVIDMRAKFESNWRG